MFLIIRRSDKKIMLSSARLVDEKSYEEQGMYVIEIPDSEYTPDMVGGTLDG